MTGPVLTFFSSAVKPAFVMPWALKMRLMAAVLVGEDAEHQVLDGDVGVTPDFASRSAKLKILLVSGEAYTSPLPPETFGS